MSWWPLAALGTHTAPLQTCSLIGRQILFELILCGKVLDVLGTPKRMRSDGQARRSLADITLSQVTSWSVRVRVNSYRRSSRCLRQIRQLIRRRIVPERACAGVVDFGFI